MKNKIFATLLALTLALSLTACGSKSDDSAKADTTDDAQTEQPAEPQETVTLNVAASPTPHAEILKQCVPILAEQGIDLQIHEYSDYVVPNTAVEDGDEDANYFQHVPYLDDFNTTRGTHLVSVTGVHIEPMGIYAGKSDSLDNLPDGASVAVPNDATNEGRALLLLEAQGLIKLADDSNLSSTPKDITENPKNLTFIEVEAANLPTTLSDADIAVINSNYALGAGLNPVTDALALESSDSPYVNVLVCKEGNENEPKIKALVAALQSQQVKDFMDENYKGAVVSVVETPTDGYDASIDYDALNGETVSCAATPAPHCEVLEVCKDILAAKGITLDIQVYNDYVVPNTVVDDGTLDANYFQHLPYLEDFNAENNTHIVSVSAIHVEPMGLYGGLQTSLDALKASK